jgi:ABC-type uncharacterized transport system involved in gliding motility auxiliary subunit
LITTAKSGNRRGRNEFLSSCSRRRRRSPQVLENLKTDNRPKPQIAASCGSLYKLLLLPLLLLLSFVVAHFEKVGNNNYYYS